MRYLLVTYDETTLPTDTYDLFDTVGRFMTEEGINAFLADLHAPSEVEACVAASSGSTPDRGVLENVLAGLDIIDEELSGLPYLPKSTSPHIEAIWDELATIRDVIRTELDRQDEVAQITEEQWNAFQTPKSPRVVFDEAAEIPDEAWDKILAQHPTNIAIVEEK